METIKLDLIPGKKMPSLHASQFDDGREHGIDLFENGVAYKLDGTETLTINERKGDDCICSLDIENTFADSNHIVFASTEQMCAVWGNNICELVIAKGEKTIGTLNFILEIEQSPTEGGIESESEIKNLERQVEAITEEVIGDDYYTAEQTDEAIENATEGKADATYVDEQLNNKMDKANPTGTGSLSLNRKAGSTVGSNSVAMGTNTRATGTNTTALGNDTLAYGENSVAMGSGSSVSGTNSVAIGNHTKANSNTQFVFGKYNKDDNNNAYAEIVGNGTTAFTKSNARTLDWQGNETLAGDLTYNGNKSLTSEISRLDGRIDNLPAPMIFKGTLGTGGTIQTLPAASASNEGFTYKVITDGTYAGQTAKSGDVFTSNGSEWVLIPAGDEDNDTWRNIKVNGVEKLGNGISSGAVDFVGSDNIEVEFDSNGNKVGVKTKNIYTKTEVDDIVSDAIYNVLPDDTASGSVANFDTSLELPIKSLEVDVNAVQEAGTPTPASPLPISGWSEISLAKCGDNLWDEETENGYLSSSDGSFISHENSICSKNYRLINPSSQVYVATSTDKTLYIVWFDENKNFISRKDVNNNVATSPLNARYFKLSCYNYGSTYNNDTSVNYPSNDTTYHAYNANTEVINLGGTYYGGHFTQDKDGHRQFEVTCVKETVSLQGNTYSTANGYDAWLIILSNRSVPAANSTNKKCSVCGTYRYEGSSVNQEHFYITSGALAIYLTENTFRDGSFEFVYPLETPIVIDLPDGEPINTLNGTNNIFADTGDTSVVFKSSVNDYVSAHSGGNLLGMGGVYLGGAKSGGSEEETDEGEDAEKVKLDDPKEEIKEIGDVKKLGGE